MTSVPDPLRQLLGCPSAHTTEAVRRALAMLRSDNRPLLQFGQLVAQLSHDIEAASHFMVEHILDEVHAGRCSLFVADADRGLALVAYAGLPEEIARRARRVDAREGVVGWVYSRGVPLLVPDVSRVRLPVARPNRYRSKGFISLPVRGPDRKAIGVINITDVDQGRTLSADDIRRAQRALAETEPILAEAWRSYNLLRLSYTDPLTGFFNRRFLQQALNYYLVLARAERFPVSLLLVDVDHFKRINDRYGHPTGDDVLKLLAELMRQHFRAEDILCRLGGEEFAVIMPRRKRSGQADEHVVDAELETYAFAERLRGAIEEYSLHALFGEDGRVTVSCGIATFPQDASTPSELLAKADEALYRAKRKGRNRVELYCPLCARKVAQERGDDKPAGAPATTAAQRSTP